MITGDRRLGSQYKDLIIEQIKKEINLSEERLKNIINRLNTVSGWEDTYSTDDDILQYAARCGVR